MKKIVVFSLIVLLLLSLSFSITGKAVLDQVKNAHSNFKTERSSVTMKLISANGGVRERQFDMYLMHAGDKTLALVRFTAPSEVKRITLLTLSDNEIYLYMPAYRRTKRISGGAKNGKFAGSDFTYNDISLLYNEKTGDYDAKLLKETDKIYLVQVIPHGSNDEYAKILITVDKDTLLFKHIEFYTSDGTKAKVMDFSAVKDFEGHKVATIITLNNIKENHKTILTINSVKFNIPITSKFFNRRNISKPILRYQ